MLGKFMLYLDTKSANFDIKIFIILISWFQSKFISLLYDRSILLILAFIAYIANKKLWQFNLSCYKRTLIKFEVTPIDLVMLLELLLIEISILWSKIVDKFTNFSWEHLTVFRRVFTISICVYSSKDIKICGIFLRCSTRM